MDAARERMGEAELDKGPVDPCPDEPVRMDANRGLVSEAGLHSEQVFIACPRFIRGTVRKTLRYTA